MADDMDFESFDNLEDLDWSELEKDIKENAEASGGAEAKQAAPQQQAAAPAANAGAPRVAGTKGGVDINYLLDVDLHATVEVGKRQYYIHQVLGWDHGSIIELDKQVGEPVEFLINNKPVARGEVVVVNDKFAIKITEIMDPQDRINSLKLT